MKSPISCLALLSVLVFSVSCSTDHKPTANTPAAAKNNSASLVGTDWLLLDLGGTPVVPNSKASLAFLDSGRAAGNASCNRFTGSVEITGASIKFGALASTRMAGIDAALSTQEDGYLKLLGAANRYERNGDSLLIYADGADKPLRFTGQMA
ncbi:MAG TPA: META domain-containing protein [Candidatus Acidoferrum sp.]